MNLFDLFRKKPGEDMDGKNRKVNGLMELEIYSGMKVVVERPGGQMLFIAKLQNLNRDTAELYQYSDAGVLRDTEVLNETDAIKAEIRGYNDRERKAVFMEGTIIPRQKHVWRVEGLNVTRVENERSFSRLSTDLDAAVVISDGDNTKEQACRLLNISAGGASIGSAHRYHKGDTFLLKAKLSEDNIPSVLYCEILRVMEKNVSSYEYGCRFLELTEADQEQIAQNIVLMEKMAGQTAGKI
ncbi:MAG TPA: PilZ domain-containing protein [Lachnospiraceae bacterium]|nr:PilZ domain-containing protein [Lachnospiraceae bacterium]